MLWMLCGASYTLSIASAYDRTSPSASWGYQPVYKSVSYGSTPYMGSTTTTTSSVYTGIGSSTMPTYHFKTTSVYHVSNAGYQRMSLPGDMVAYGSLDGPPDGPGVGELEDEEDPMPVGDTPWILMLLLITAYYLIVCRSTRWESCRPRGRRHGRRR